MKKECNDEYAKELKCSGISFKYRLMVVLTEILLRILDILFNIIILIISILISPFMLFSSKFFNENLDVLRKDFKNEMDKREKNK